MFPRTAKKKSTQLATNAQSSIPNKDNNDLPLGVRNVRQELKPRENWQTERLTENCSFAHKFQPKLSSERK